MGGSREALKTVGITINTGTGIHSAPEIVLKGEIINVAQRPLPSLGGDGDADNVVVIDDEVMSNG